MTFVQQINIPKQTEHVHWLTFSPVEDHFYRRQYTISIQDSMKVIVNKSYLTVRVYSVSFNPWMLFLSSYFWFFFQRLDKWRDPTVKLSSLDRATANQVRASIWRKESYIIVSIAAYSYQDFILKAIILIRSVQKFGYWNTYTYDIQRDGFLRGYN